MAAARAADIAAPAVTPIAVMAAAGTAGAGAGVAVAVAAVAAAGATVAVWAAAAISAAAAVWAAAAVAAAEPRADMTPRHPRNRRPGSMGGGDSSSPACPRAAAPRTARRDRLGRPLLLDLRRVLPESVREPRLRLRLFPPAAPGR